MRPVSLQLYRLGTALLTPLAPTMLKSRAKQGKEDLARLNERLGHPRKSRPNERLVWLHGASVGESLSILPLIEALRMKKPDLAVLVTSGTVTSAELIAKRLPKDAVHQYAPLDTPGAATRFLQHWNPDLAVFVESEIWPNLILGAQTQGSKLALVSARLSDRSLKGWRRAPAAAKAIFGAFDRVMAQDDAAAASLSGLGARDDGRLNLKRLGAPLAVDAVALPALRKAANGWPVLLAASTHSGEDEIILDAWRKVGAKASLVIVPRHPARAADIETLVQNRGFSVGLRSRGDAFDSAEVYVADTLGELGLWFSLANAAFIGGSLLRGPGGHNPIEAAQMNCPIITGPHLDNWKTVYADLFKADAASLVQDGQGLAQSLIDVLANPAAARGRAERAHHVVAQDQGALNLAVEGLISLLP